MKTASQASSFSESATNFHTSLQCSTHSQKLPGRDKMQNFLQNSGLVSPPCLLTITELSKTALSQRSSATDKKGIMWAKQNEWISSLTYSHMIWKNKRHRLKTVFTEAGSPRTVTPGQSQDPLLCWQKLEEPYGGNRSAIIYVLLHFLIIHLMCVQNKTCSFNWEGNICTWLKKIVKQNK